ncbi:hypothetical protein [Celeribacter sp.]|uniref:hypothetical protein n=1 Tax=Celeribacter sp. TaxID=1890673 RepID=UPI003A929006
MKDLSRTVVVTVLVGAFVILGAGVLCDLATRFLPAYAERAYILGRDTHQTILPEFATRTRTFTSVRRVTLADDDGIPFTINAPKVLYDRALPGLLEGMPVSIRRSVLFDKPVELEITQDPLVDLSDFPALSRLLEAPANKTPARVATFDLRLPYVLSIGWLAMLGLMAWAMIRMPRKEQFVWPLFGGGMAISAALGTWWWVG